MTVSVLSKPDVLSKPQISSKIPFFLNLAKLESQPTESEPQEDLLFEEDPPLESDWHVSAMTLLISILRYFWRDRNDIYVSGNTAVYFDPNHKTDRHFRGPDLYVVKGVYKMPRSSWIIWKENHFAPDFVMELASKSSARFDTGGKKEIYEKELKTPEYVVYNPRTEIFWGWQLTSNGYELMPFNEPGWLWCNELGLWLGLGEYDFLDGAGLVKTPRFFDKEGQLLLTEKEAEAQRAKTEAQRASAEAQRAEQAEKRAEFEAQARYQAELEVARLKVLLENQK